MIINIIKGFFIGIAAVVPGLSASIFAIVVGLYEQLLFAVSDLRNDFWTHVKFLIPISIGGVLGVLLSVDLMLMITERWPAYSYLFFAGLVIGSIPMIVQKIKKGNEDVIVFKAVNLVYTVLAFLVVVVMANTAGDGDHIALYRIDGIGDFFLILMVGAVSISLLVLPGVSGSLILIVLGHFGTIYHAASQFGNLAISLIARNYDEAFTAFYSVFILVPFGIGAVIGLVSIAKLMNWVLERHEVSVYYAVLGTLLASIWVLFDMGVLSHMPSRDEMGAVIVFSLLGMVWVALGYLCTKFLDKE